MTKRKTNPYQLTDDEKLAVVELYAQNRTTSHVVDQVMRWKPNAATGDIDKDRKYVRDAIRTCNPKSSAFSFQIALTARRAEYLAEGDGALVAAVCETAHAVAEGIPHIKFDFTSVTPKDLPNFVSALKELFELMTAMGITVTQDISESVRFGQRLDEHPENRRDELFVPYNETRREMWGQSEPYELAKSKQIETGTGRSAEHLDAGVYPENYEIPDVHVTELWETLHGSGDGKLPSIKQMRCDLDDTELFEKVFGGHDVSFEHRLELYRMLLSHDWDSLTPKWTEWRRQAFADALQKLRKPTARETDGTYDSEKEEHPTQAPSAVESNNGDRSADDTGEGPPPIRAVETAADLAPKEKHPNNGHATQR
jgi:hypothetical protein